MSNTNPTDHVRRIEHDLRHQVGTIGALASLISTSPDIDEQSRRRSIQLLTELTWLDELIDSMQPTAGLGSDEATARVAVEHVAVEELVPAVVEAVSATTPARIGVDLQPVSAAMSRVALWRALRNLVMNAVAATDGRGTVAVEVRAGDRDDVVICVDDDGPGFDAGAADVAGRRGLRIVRELVAAAGGRIEIGISPLGGCRVCLHVPRAERTARAEAATP